MELYYKLAQPRRQPGVTGIVFPIQWSKTEDPWEPYHNGTLIVSGYVDETLAVHYDEAELEAKIEAMEDILIAEAEGANLTLPKGIQERMLKPMRTKRKRK